MSEVFPTLTWLDGELMAEGKGKNFYNDCKAILEHDCHMDEVSSTMTVPGTKFLYTN